MCQEEEGGNLGKVRQTLRKFAGYPDIQNFPELKKPKKTEKDMMKIRQEVAAMQRIEPSNQYLSFRGISKDTINDKRFLIMQEGQYKNVTFVHYSLDNEICGYEQKNTGQSRSGGKSYTHFSDGGSKGIWRSNNLKNAQTVVICEAGIDCLSHAQLKGTGDYVAYISICGQMSQVQLDILTSVCIGKGVVIATDNDEAGNLFALKIEKATDGVALSVVRDMPVLKDWNDDLLQHQKNSLTNTGHTR
jgi:5S rRNA maturation endonuclease (ribonuclease M5)